VTFAAASIALGGTPLDTDRNEVDCHARNSDHQNNDDPIKRVGDEVPIYQLQDALLHEETARAPSAKRR
jgi:hypothetical protein